MTKRTIEIDDTLPGCVQSAIEQTEELLRDYLRDNPDADETPCLYNDLNYSGLFHEIVDGCVPIYTAEIDAAWFLHGRELEEAYGNAGIGTNPREKDGIVAIYCYIEQEAAEWYRKNAELIFGEIKEGGAE